MRISLKTNNNMLVYLLLFAQISALGIFDNVFFMGRPVTAYVRYLVFLISFMNLALYVAENRKHRVLGMWFLLTFVICGVIGYASTEDFMEVLIEASHYVTIVAVYFWVVRHNFPLEKIMRIVYIIIPILLTTSILSSFGYLQGMRDASGGLLRSSVDVDGTIGVIVTMAVFHEIHRKAKASLLDYTEFISGCLVVCFSISRGRILVFLICLFIYLISTIRCRNCSRLRKLLPLIILASAVFLLFSDVIGDLFNQIVARFGGSTIKDVNLLKRSNEILKHLSIFEDHIIFGSGWGMLSKYYINDHCSYTAVLAFMGLLGGVPYLGWFFYNLLTSFINALKAKKIGKYHLSFIMILAVMLLAIANMSFDKTGGIWGMLIAYVSLIDNSSKEESC